MSTHQPGIFREDTAHQIFMEFKVFDQPALLPGRALASSPVVDGEQIIAFGVDFAKSLPSLSLPTGARSFSAVEGAGFVAPQTQQDLFIWLHGERRDELFARALAWRNELRSGADLSRDEHGFRFRDNRDLTGFVDGSANPKEDARQAVALIADGDCAGGCFVLTQRWVHRLDAFGALMVAAQERVIGRTKKDSIELQGDVMPPDSHVSRTDIKRGGEAVKIYRRSSPVGGLQDPGLYFLAFSADQARFGWLLESMYGQTEDGRHDQLLHYSKPVSGSFFYAPPQAAMLESFRDA